MKKRIIVLICLVFILVNCQRHNNKYNFVSKKEKKFYTDCNGMDYIRFPLIMPYDVMCFDLRNKNWTINLGDSIMFYSSIPHVDELFVNNGIILVHSTSTHQELKDDKPKLWFVIIPSKRIEKGFSEEVDMNDYIKQFNITKINWIKTQSAYDQFKNTGCLPWIPGCQ